MNESLIKGALIVLYAEMAALTEAECATVCGAAYAELMGPAYARCCEGNGHMCEAAIERATDVFGVTLARVHHHPTLSLMGPAGCTAAPHYRPLCTIHTCEINSLGFKRGAPEWTDEYFARRERLMELEAKRLSIQNLKETEYERATIRN